MSIIFFIALSIVAIVVYNLVRSSTVIKSVVSERIKQMALDIVKWLGVLALLPAIGRYLDIPALSDFVRHIGMSVEVVEEAVLTVWGVATAAWAYIKQIKWGAQVSAAVKDSPEVVKSLGSPSKGL
jgi:hypothetical protein